MTNGSKKSSRMVPPKPSELMRSWHPEFFSDTETRLGPTIPQAVLEFHIDSLTSRKQENEFEHFCRRLAEKEICPNLRKPVGPSGGGDGKVDSETYPVAPFIAERWWIGSPSAGAERWAFAFSAKKTWKPKAKADVEGIVSTGRGYSRIHFFTNQSVSDRVRQEQEEALTKLADVPVTIYDRGWLVQKVMEGGHVALAIETLDLQGFDSEQRTRPGPQDSARIASLEALDSEIADPAKFGGARHQLIESCLSAALLARNLGRPRAEVDGRFEQTARLGREVGYKPQQLRIAYFRAWTAFWWYEDYNAFNEFYDEVEKLAAGSKEATELERLTTLWQLLKPSVLAGRIAGKDAKLAHRTKRLRKWLNALAGDALRLNNALQARTSLAFTRMTELGPDPSESDQATVWAELSAILDAAEGLGAFPFERVFETLERLGEFIDSASFDALYEKAVEAARTRRDAGTAGRLYAERGGQKMKQEHWYDAIQWFGRAEEVLIKEEYRQELVEVLLDASLAYENVGLYWAARAKAIAAAHRSFGPMLNEGESGIDAVMAARRLVHLDLITGRLPQILSSMQLARLIEGAAKLSDKQRKTLEEIQGVDDAALGHQILRIPIAQLHHVRKLPDVLEREGLHASRLATLYALGDMTTVRANGYFPDGTSEEAILDGINTWHDYRGYEDLAELQGFGSDARNSMTTVVLGTEFVLETSLEASSVGIAESILGALEAFLATSDESDLLPHRQRTRVVVRSASDQEGPPVFRALREGGSETEVVHKTDFSFETAIEGQAFLEWLWETVVVLFTSSFVIRDHEAWAAKVGRQERAFARALSLGDLITLNEHVFGLQPKLRLSDWLAADDRDYELLRITHWREGVGARPGGDAARRRNPTRVAGTDTFDRGAFRHRDLQAVSPIDMALWDRAQWRGVIFGVDPDPAYAPILGLAFLDMDAAELIFRAWQQACPNLEADHLLRVSIIQGLANENPARYCVCIGPSPRVFEGDPDRLFFVTTRSNRMEARTSEGVDKFIAAARAFGGFLLAPAAMVPEVRFATDLGIGLRALSARQAYEIGPHDQDIMGLSPDDDPIIPPTMANAPVVEALARLRAMRERRSNE